MTEDLMADSQQDAAPRHPEPRPGHRRRPYHRPVLTEYGSVAKLTQTGGNTTKDATTLKRKCL